MESDGNKKSKNELLLFEMKNSTFSLFDLSKISISLEISFSFLFQVDT